MADFDKYGNLYPPSLPTYAKAFVADAELGYGTATIPFSVSNYNAINELDDYVQVIITEQDTNQTALNTSKYPASVMWVNWKNNIDSTSNPGYLYYITIGVNDLAYQKWELNKYYKVQLRFQKAGLGAPASGTELTWLYDKQELFSEWSTVCLARAISQPTFNIVGLTPRTGIKKIEDMDEFLPDQWQIETIQMVGKLTFKNENETETLRNYRLKIYNSMNELLDDSGEIYSNYQSRKNEINYTFKYLFEDGATYIIKLDYTTTNLYAAAAWFKVVIVQSNVDPLEGTVTTELDQENARIGVRVKSNSTAPFAGKITIRRTSSESNFTKWEDVHSISLRNETLNYIWYDATIKSGVWYLYGAQKRDGNGNRGIMQKSSAPEMIIFDHIYLTAGNTQLKIKYNPQVSSFQRTIMESKVDTLGGKYPHIKRNGETCYRQFPIGGLISSMIDDCSDTNHAFEGDSLQMRVPSSYESVNEMGNILTSKEKVWDEEVINLYETYNNANNIDMYNDIVWEHEFREKVMDFLYENNVKLFRSATEGNIIIKLMDISFTPEATLGRRLYSFSATAYEIADYSIENLDAFNIQNINERGNMEDVISYSIQHEGKWIGQVPAYAKTQNEEENVNMPINFIDMLNEYYQKEAIPKYILSVENLDFLRLEFETDPYLIKETSEGPIPIENNSADSEEAKNAILGHIVYITLANNRGKEIPIVVGPEGIYELKGKDIEIIGIRFAQDENIDINYHVNITQTEDTNQILKSTVYRTQLGQEHGAFLPGEAIFEKIWNKFYLDYSGYYQAVVSLDGMRVEADQGTVLYVCETGESKFDRHVIGQTESLDFWDPDSSIDALYFVGAHFEEALDFEAQRENTPANKYIDTKETIEIDVVNDDLENVRAALEEKYPNPRKNGVYNVSLRIINPIATLSLEQAENNAAAAIPNNSITSIIDVLGKTVTVIPSEMVAIIEPNDEEILKEYLEEKGYIVILSTDSALENKTFNTVDIESQRKIIDYKTLTNTAQLDKKFAKVLSDNLANSQYIYYNHQWWPFTNDHDVVCPVPAMIDYICEIMKGYYAVVQN